MFLIDTDNKDSLVENSSTSNKKKFLNNTIIGAIIIGLISSALWEKIISPFSTFVFTKILQLANLIFKGVTDSTYKDISKGFHEFYSLSSYIIILSFMAGGFYALARMEFSSNSKPKSYVSNKTNKKNKVSMIILIVIYFTYAIFIIGKYTLVNQVQTTTLSNIEIVSPYITDIEYKTLKSKFYSMNSSADYDMIVYELQNIANINNIDLK